MPSHGTPLKAFSTSSVVRAHRSVRPPTNRFELPSQRPARPLWRRWLTCQHGSRTVSRTVLHLDEKPGPYQVFVKLSHHVQEADGSDLRSTLSVRLLFWDKDQFSHLPWFREMSVPEQIVGSPEISSGAVVTASFIGSAGTPSGPGAFPPLSLSAAALSSSNVNGVLVATGGIGLSSL
jgi:hypothetical protein